MEASFYPIIIADDSNDKYKSQNLKIIEKYKSKTSIEVIDLPFDSGLSKGRNEIVSKCKTKYIMILDDSRSFTSDLNVLNMIKLGIDAGGLMFKFGALIMLPIVVGITLLNVVIGIVTRSAPTLNLFSFGFPITMLFAFFLLYVCTITIGSNFSNITNVSVDFLQRLFEDLI